MSTTSTRSSSPALSTDAFLSELVASLPIVILYRAIRASWKPSAGMGGSLRTAASH